MTGTQLSIFVSSGVMSIPPHFFFGSTLPISGENVDAESLGLPYLGKYVITDEVLRISAVVTSIVDPLIEGTSVPIYRITALLTGGMTVDEVVEDFPSLSREQVEGTRGYLPIYSAVANYPKMSLKRLLRDSGMYDLDQELKELKKKTVH